MPYANKYNHPWNMQWNESPFMDYKRKERLKNSVKRGASRKNGKMLSLALAMTLAAMSQDY